MFTEVSVGVIDDLICAQLTAERAFLVGGCRSNHFGTHSLGDLNRRGANATCRAQNQHGFTRLEFSTVHQGMEGGGIDHDESRSINGVEAWREGQAQLGRRQGVGGEAARARQARHGLAYFQMLHIAPDGFNHASVFRARHKGQGWLHLVFVLNDQQIGKIQTGRLNSNQNFICPWGGCGQFGPLQCLYTNRVLAKPSFHGFFLKN